MNIYEIATITITVVLFAANIVFALIGLLIVRLLSKSKDEVSKLNQCIDHLYQSVNTLNVNLATVVANLTNASKDRDWETN